MAGFVAKNTPSWTVGGWWKKSSKSSIGGNRYKSSLGYSSSSFYDCSSGNYYNKYGTSFTNLEDTTAVEKLLVSAYKSIREAVIILDFPFVVDICFSGRSFFGKSKTGRKIFLPTNSIDNSETKDRSDAEKIDILCGCGIHEASHLKYTEIRVLKAFSDMEGDPLSIFLANVIEDERVEDLLLKERPGYENYLVKKKTFEYNSYILPYSRHRKGLDLLLYMVYVFMRFRGKINEGDIKDDYLYIFDEIDKQLQEGIYNSKSTTNTKTSCQIGKSLSETIRNLLIKNHGISLEELNSAITKLTTNSNKFYSDVLSGSDEQVIEDSGSIGKKITGLVSSSALLRIEKLATGDYIKDGNTYIDLSKEGDLDLYNSIKKEISPYIAPLRRVLVSQDKNYDFVIHGCRSGILDTTKLAEAYQGVPQVYTRMGQVRTNRTTICILVDESGSMFGGSRISKCRIARETAILFNEAFGKVPGVDLFIYGHTADELGSYTTTLFVYREPGYKMDKIVSLTSIDARCENRDGEAILAAAKRVKKINPQPGTIFVISDGSPSAMGYRGYSAINDTRQKIVQAQNLGYNVVGVCIDRVCDADKMYDSYIDISSNLSTFSKKLGRIIKKTIMSSKETVTS